MSLSLFNCTFAYSRSPLLFNELSIEFEPGKTVLLGPNGAGKSTLLSLCAGALRAKDVSPRLDGLSPRSSAYRRRVAWLPQSVAAFPGLSVIEQVVYYGWLKGMSSRSACDRAEGALAAVRLESLKDKRARDLSGGQLRRLGIAGALIHNADVLLLDEPFAGLDPSQRSTLAAVIAGISSDTTLVVSTHQTEDFTSIYDRAVVLVGGQVAFDGSARAFVGTNDGEDPVRSAYLSYVGIEA